MDAICARARFGDLDLDARSRWAGKGKQIGVECSATKQAIRIKLAATVGQFLHDLDFANVHMA